MLQRKKISQKTTGRAKARNRLSRAPKTTQMRPTLTRRWFYEKNKKFLEDPVNKTFEEILWMSDCEFRNWVAELRRVVIDLWDNEDAPPTGAQDEQEIVNQFEQIESFPVSTFLKNQIGKSNQKVILNNPKIGSVVSQWFPTMMRTKINNQANLKAGLSIYDHFKNDDLFEKLVTYVRRNFKRDSFGHYSHPVLFRATEKDKYLFCCNTGREWILKFETQGKKLREKYDYWLLPQDKKPKSTGISDKLRNATKLTITKSGLNNLPIPAKCRTNLAHKPKAKLFQIRVFRKGERLFPNGFTAFEKTFSQKPANFPPLTAKFLYERYLYKLGVEKAIIWDPSAGWGGRILGAMGISREFKVHYIGTDPNRDHTTANGRTKYHELADYYNEVRIGRRRSHKRRKRTVKEVNTYEIFQCGSETMHKQKRFQKYKGKVDIVFTSPPYFNKEVYSDDPEQSARKFDEYANWRDGFLKRTLKTAVEWLRPGGYLIWNIANIRLGNRRLPLEDDSCSILKNLGMERIEVLKMALANSPGGNRINATMKTVIEETYNDITGAKVEKQERQKLSAKHGCWISDDDSEKNQKYEPVFIYQKPSKKHRRSIREEAFANINTDDTPIECAKVVSDFVSEFKRAINGNKINPNHLRAIYSALEKRIAGKEQDMFFKSFNRQRKDYFIIERIPDGMKLGVPQFAQRKIVNRSIKRLVGKTVLAQIVETNKTEIRRIFAYAEVIKPGDDPHTVWVKITEDKRCAECYQGDIIRIRSVDVLQAGAAQAPFILK